MVDDIFAELRFLSMRKFLSDKIETSRCKCGTGSQGTLGNRDKKTGLVQVNLLNKKGSVRCVDIGIGKLGKNNKVIAFVPTKKETGFVDYKK